MAAIALLGGANCVQIDREPLLSWSPTPADDGPPKNYFVPHFGTDEEIKAVPVSIAAAEKIVGHKFLSDADVLGKPMAPPNPRNYFVPNFGEDSEVVSTLKSMDYAEKQLNHKW